MTGDGYPKVDGEEATDDPTGFYRFDELTQVAWTQEAVEKLDHWKQGDLLPGSPLMWAGPAGPDAVLGTKGTGPSWEPVDEGALADGWAIVTSQTCDVAGTGPGAVQPFVDVSPVFRYPDTLPEAKQAAIQAFGVTYLVALTNPPAPGLWVADLRLSVPVSKGLLCEHTPRTPWASELDRLNFAEAVGTRKRRPALHDAITSELVRSLGNYIKTTHKTDPEWWENVEQVRLLVTGDRLQPTSVALLVCEKVPLDRSQKTIWRAWRRQGRKLIKPITLEPHLFQTLEEMPAALYKQSVPLRIPELGRPPTW